MNKKVVSLLSLLLIVYVLAGCASVNAEPVVESADVVSRSLPVMDDGDFYEVFDADGRYMTGSAIKTENLRVAYLDCDPDWKDYSEYYHPQDGYRVVRGFFRFENLSDDASGCGRFDFVCQADGVTCQEFYVGDNDGLPSFSALGVGEQLDGWLYFAVPDSAKLVEFIYSGDNFMHSDSDRPVFVVG